MCRKDMEGGGCSLFAVVVDQVALAEIPVIIYHRNM